MKKVSAFIDQSRYKTVINNGNHQIIADEPAPYGTDLGQDPYSLLLASLGGCVAMTVRMYADRKEWDLDSVEVHLSQERVHAKDCDDCTSKEGFVHVIDKKVKLNGNLTEEQHAKLMEIADRCPVHKTLLNEIKINTMEL